MLEKQHCGLKKGEDQKMNELVIATRNSGKVSDFKDLFSGSFQVKSLIDFPEVPEIIEDGNTFKENAAKKAETLSAYLNRPVLADDSGLIVDALDGRPGVFSARYAGPDKSDQDNIDKVLQEMADLAVEDRTARFYCVIALAKPGKETVYAEGSCEGIITREESGTNGFGYDPIFFVPSHNKTMAQLSSREKNEISHRANALRNFKKQFVGGLL